MASVRAVAVILAGGTGSRVGLTVPKQLLKVAGRPVMEHTIAVFEAAEGIDDIYVLMHPDHLQEAIEIASRFPKVRAVLPGRETRNATTQAALDALHGMPDDTKVVIHDAVRPLVSQQIITDSLAALDSHEAVDVAIRSADTIIEVDDEAILVGVPPRNSLRRGQTPQSFRLRTIRDAYRWAWEDPGFSATDDCSVVLRYSPHVPIVVVNGHESNMKITEPIDVYLADRLFQLRSHDAPQPHTDEYYSEKLTGKSIVVLGGSRGIGAELTRLARRFGANVHAFSRSTTGTHIESEDDIVAALRSAVERSGRIDAIVVTAGVLTRGRLRDMPVGDVVSAVNINYVAPMLVARAGFQYLSATHGHLLLFTSSSYTRGRADYAVYSSAKAAIVNLTQALSDEWSEDGVRVNCLNPERTATPMRTEAFGPEPASSLLTAEDVARAALDVLASDSTGAVVDVRRPEPRS